MDYRLRSRLVWTARLKAECIGSSQHAAVVVYKKKKIIAVGWNKRKSHPLCVEYQPNPQRIYLHAEMDAIIKTINRHGPDMLPDCKLVVLRLTKGGRIAESKPCEGCMSLINAMNVGEVEWT